MLLLIEMNSTTAKLKTYKNVQGPDINPLGQVKIQLCAEPRTKKGLVSFFKFSLFSLNAKWEHTKKGGKGGKGMKGSQKYLAGSQMSQEQHFSGVSAVAEDEKESEKKNAADGIFYQDVISMWNPLSRCVKI